MFSPDEGFYNIDGEPITLKEWAALFELREEYGRIAVHRDGDLFVSTVWLGNDNSFGEGEPLIFETMVFGHSDPRWEDFQVRWSTQEGARRGHELVVALINAGRSPDDIWRQ